MYDLSDEQTDDVIKSFKSKFNTTAQRSSSNQQALALDSSIWLLEAALNSDFDEPKSNETMIKDSLIFSTSFTNNEITAADFDNAYLNLKTLVNQKKSNNLKVQVIDVTAQVTDNTIRYFLDITFFNSSTAQKVATPCDPFTTETASPSLYATAFPSYTNSFLSCSGNPTLDGPFQVETKLNGCSLPACSNGYYYTNITTRSGNGQNYPSKLYYRYNMTLSDFCLPANKIIGAWELNQYKNGSQYLANLWKPTSPSGLSIINNYDIKLEIYSTLCSCPTPYFAFWSLTVSYGVLHCNNGGGS